MNETNTELSPEVTAEIERHKYFLSEKAGYDVGWEFAEQDWFAHHADGPLIGDHRVDPGSNSGKPSGLSRFLKRMFSKS